MNWLSLTDEERKEWRKHPTTLAYFASLQREINDARDEVVTCMLDPDNESNNRARRMAGRVDGMETAIKLMETDG